LQELPPPPPHSVASCRICRGNLEKTSGRSITAALACSLGTFLLLFPCNALPLLRVDMFSMHMQNVIAGGIASLWGGQWLLIAGLSAVFVIIVPFLRFGLLSAVLGALRLGHRPRWLGWAFRWAIWLDPWGMPDVYLLAAFVGYYRLISLANAVVSIQLGGVCFIAAGLLTMLSRAALDRRTIWRALHPETGYEPGTDTLSCTTCDLIQPISCEEQPCPRCGARLRARKPDAMPRTAALLIAAFACFFPANLLPMEVSSHLGNEVRYTIFTGVSQLYEHSLWLMGIIIFCTSILIPVLKIAVLGWCLLSVWRRSSRHLVAKTKVFRLVAELGRWSKTDPFTIVFFVPLVNIGALASATAGWGAEAFMMMTLLTMVASITFDPRMMWDAALPGRA
jgi:paraquat-inducible protein A